MSNNSKVLFRIKTGDYKTFKNESGDEITFLNTNISRNDIKPEKVNELIINNKNYSYIYLGHDT